MPQPMHHHTAVLGHSTVGHTVEDRPRRCNSPPWPYLCSQELPYGEPGCGLLPGRGGSEYYQVLRCSLLIHHLHQRFRDLGTLLQIRQFAHLRSTTCSLQGLSSTQRSTQTTPSRDLTVGVMQLATLRSPEPVGGTTPVQDDSKESLDDTISRPAPNLRPQSRGSS
jgi:hypothetical protein